MVSEEEYRYLVSKGSELGLKPEVFYLRAAHESLSYVFGSTRKWCLTQYEKAVSDLKEKIEGV